MINYARALKPYLHHPTHIFRNIWWRSRKTTSSERHIFIVGAPRSGTTLLQSILAAHEKLCTYEGESNFFGWPDIFDENRSFFGISGPLKCQLLKISNDLVELFDNAANFANKGNKRFVEKTPQHVFRISFLRKHFPASKVINIYRDGRDCFCSARTAALPHGKSVRDFARYWRRCIRARSREGDDPDILDLFYEDFTARPEHVIKRTMIFVGEKYECQQLWVDRRAVDRRAGHSQFSRLAGPIDMQSQGRWRTEMGRRDVEIFQRIAGKELQQLGYELL